MVLSVTFPVCRGGRAAQVVLTGPLLAQSTLLLRAGRTVLIGRVTAAPAVLRLQAPDSGLSGGQSWPLCLSGTEEIRPQAAWLFLCDLGE